MKRQSAVLAITATALAAGAAPAAAETVYGVTSGTPQLVTFDSASPGTVRTTVTISGLPAGRNIAGIDVRPATNRLTVLDDAGQLYTLDARSGALTAVGTPSIAGALDIDFNPTVDRIRVVGQPGTGGGANTGNARLNPNNGAVGGTDTDVAFANGDPNFGETPAVSATAYTNSFPASQTFPNPPTTAQFDLEAGNDVLVRQNPPNAGTLTTIGSGLGVDVATTGAHGFDVVTDADGTTNRAYAALGSAAAPAFYRIDTTAGTATKVGDFPASAPVVDIAVAPSPPTLAVLRDTLLGQQVAFFAADRPQDSGDATATITGLPAGVTITNIDQRPANGALYGLGSDGRLYVIAVPTGAATAVATVSPALSGNAFGFDFNPTVDRIRIVSDTGQNLRVNPDTGAAVVDTNLSGTGVTAAAYTNSVRGATATTLFDIDSATDRLLTQDPPNNGTLNVVGPLGAGNEVTGQDGYDIAPRFNQGFATQAITGGANLLAVNVASTAVTPPATLAPANGGAVLVGRIAGNATVRGLAVYDPGAVVAPAPETPTTPATPGTPTNPGTVPTAPAKLRTRISARLTPSRDRKSPFRYTLKGRVVVKGQTAAGQFTGGRVTVRAKRTGRSKTLRTVRVRVSATGRFTARITVPSKGLRKRGSGKVTMHQRFGGTDALFSSRAFDRARYR